MPEMEKTRRLDPGIKEFCLWVCLLSVMLYAVFRYVIFWITINCCFYTVKYFVLLFAWNVICSIHKFWFDPPTIIFKTHHLNKSKQCTNSNRIHNVRWNSFSHLFSFIREGKATTEGYLFGFFFSSRNFREGSVFHLEIFNSHYSQRKLNEKFPSKKVIQFK